MHTYNSKSFDQWLAEGKSTGFGEYSQKKKLIKKFFNFLKIFLKNILNHINFFPKIYKKISPDIKKQFVSVFFTIIMFKLINFLLVFIQKYIYSIYSKIFLTKTIPNTIDSSTFSRFKMIFKNKFIKEIWTFFKPILQAVIIKKCQF